jgi:3-deoxy-7-phosphoheptulonate synthase/chorismate mutase
MGNNELDQLRNRVDEVNLELLKLINERAQLVQDIARVKEGQGVYRYDPIREEKCLIQ